MYYYEIYFFVWDKMPKRGIEVCFFYSLHTPPLYTSLTANKKIQGKLRCQESLVPQCILVFHPVDSAELMKDLHYMVSKTACLAGMNLKTWSYWVLLQRFLTTMFFFLTGVLNGGLESIREITKKEQQNQQTGVREKSLQNFKAWLIFLFFSQKFEPLFPLQNPLWITGKSILMVKNPRCCALDPCCK